MSSYETLDLRDIDLSRLTLVKETYQWMEDQDHSRWVFRSHQNGDYFKIWNPTYVHRDRFLRGLDSGFYDETTAPALKAVITSDGVCRGYVMHKCKPVRDRDPDFHDLILEKTARTRLFSVQYSRRHAMQFGIQFSLIDLEAVHPLLELSTLTGRYDYFFEDPDYERFVIELYCRLFPHLPPIRPHTPVEQKSSAIESMQSRVRTWTQQLSSRWGVLFNHIDRIE